MGACALKKSLRIVRALDVPQWEWMFLSFVLVAEFSLCAQEIITIFKPLFSINPGQR